jgi:hypothetical protein
MHDETSAAARRELQELLLGYLRAADCPRWPGADGLTVQDVLAGYAEAAALGRVPDLVLLRRRHPELAEALRSFFAVEATEGGGASTPDDRRPLGQQT